MYITMTQPLFPWERLDDQPDVATVRAALAAIPDGPLLEGLRRHRGKGRDDYPVEVCWGAFVLTALLRHPTTDACLGELRRNRELRALLGVQQEHQVPKKHNMSRFLALLGREPHRTRLREVFDAMVRRLAAAVPDLGERLAGDATHLTARRDRTDGGSGLPGPSQGRKEYHDEAGQVTQVLQWFGYKLHLMVDAKHEVALGYAVSPAHDADVTHLPGTLQQTRGNLPPGRTRSCAYDKAADSGAVHELLDEAEIRPLIQIRACWKEESERVLRGHEGRVVYDEAGTLYCYDTVSDPPVRHRMAYIGHEPSRRTLKYRCPARHEDWTCPCEGVCNAGKDYGKTVRAPRDLDLRRFPPIPRATKQFERLYKGRTSVERVNARLKVFWGADDGNLAGPARFHAWIGIVLVTHLSLATLLASVPRRDGTLGRMRLTPIAQALRTRLTG